MSFMHIIDRLKNWMFIDWNPWFRENIINPHHRRMLSNYDVSILCNNCVGAVITHELGLQFRSPFVNLWLYPKDYIKFCENMEHYLNCELNFVPHSENHITYPVARLDDITIYFQHYASEEDTRAKWERRKKE